MDELKKNKAVDSIIGNRFKWLNIRSYKNGTGIYGCKKYDLKIWCLDIFTQWTYNLELKGVWERNL